MEEIAMRPSWLISVFIVFPVIFFGLTTNGMAQDSILICNFYKGAFFDLTKPNIININDDKFTVIFAGLDSNTPTMRGNVGEEKVEILQYGGDVIWLAERPLLGGVNVWTIFLKKKVALMSKQYLLFGQKITGLMSIATCE
ncbi:hypothetical protein MYX64_03360 [Nitrospinae bacterium AH_259_B05_G02_I21]|nr:hypothetical protein [Nitrospinae bacterium AH_259_B05_G02_I21]MDA2932634.1 hypothetical protein [Nitrospinae bacterium AH-259-F20]